MNDYYLINLENKNLFASSGLVLAILGILGLLALLVSSTLMDFDAKFLGRFTLKVLIWGEIPMIALLVYLILHALKDKLNNNMLLVKEIMFVFLIIHIILFLLASLSVALHTWVLYQQGQVCVWNNILLVCMLLISVTEILLWSKGSLVNLPRSSWGMAGIWFYWLFVTSFIGPVLAHATSRLNA